jgi:hypothetical protein
VLTTKKIAAQILDGSAPLVVVAAAYCADEGISREELGARACVSKSSTYAALANRSNRSLSSRSGMSRPAEDLAWFLGYAKGSWLGDLLREPAAKRLATGLSVGSLPLGVALSTWCAANSLHHADVGPLIGLSPTVWSSAKHRGGPSQGLEEAVRKLIRYPRSKP